jgi:hypothetical protein
MLEVNSLDWPMSMIAELGVMLIVSAWFTVTEAMLDLAS